MMTYKQYEAEIWLEGVHLCQSLLLSPHLLKRMEYVPNIFMSFDKYLFLEVIRILI